MTTEKTIKQLIPEILFYISIIIAIGYYTFRGEEASVESQEEKLNNWFNSDSETYCEYHLKEQLRDPESYKKDGSFTTPSNNGEKKIITWKFRSKNGFGGYVPSIGMCLITKENGGTVKATILNQ